MKTHQISDEVLQEDIDLFALARLPEPMPPVVDGKTPGQVCWEKWAVIPPVISHEWNLIQNKEAWEAAASAVLAAFGQSGLDAAIARMESIQVDDLCGKFVSGATLGEMAEDVRARLIAAAREGQPDAVDWKAQADRLEHDRNSYRQAASDAEARAEKAEAERGICEDNAFKMQAQITELINQRDQLLAVLATKLDSSPTFQAHGKTWTRHTPGDPMPCDAKALVDCIGDNNIILGADSADTWHWSGTIIGWRYADEPASTVPLDASDIRATDEFRAIKGNSCILIATMWTEQAVFLYDRGRKLYSQLAANYLRRQHGSTEWKPCTKEARP